MTEPTHTAPTKPTRAAELIPAAGLIAAAGPTGAAEAIPAAGPIPAAVIGLLRGAVAPAELDGPVCGAAAFLRAGGPVRVPFRQCCAVALLQAARDPGPTAAPPFCPERLSADLAPVPVPRPSEVIA